MKKVIIGIGLVVGMVSTAQAGMWNRLSNMNNEKIETTAEYQLETSGWNIRIYEWVPKHNKNIRCMFATGERKGGITCYPVESNRRE